MRLKRLTYFCLKSFIGPFVVTFAISMFILIMQFTWKYIDDLMGKGLSFGVIAELMLYVSASLIPLALPLAILLSSIMTMGNLAENNELVALKSSGLSLFRIMRPLIYAVFVIAGFTFYFANYVIPIADMKWHTLIQDIQETKVSMLLTPGSYTTEITDYAIKIESGKDNHFEGITIHDYHELNIHKTVKADSGMVYKSADQKSLLFQLFNGKVYEELVTTPPLFDGQGNVLESKEKLRPSRYTSFQNATYKMDLSGFKLFRRKADASYNAYEMLNVFQISNAMDSLRIEYSRMAKFQSNGFLQARPYFHSENFKISPRKSVDPKIQEVFPAKIISVKSLNLQQEKSALTRSLSSFNDWTNVKSSRVAMEDQFNAEQNRFGIEFHRKFALTFAIIVLFFVGAPLGAIVRKGGFGAPVVIAALLFMIYFVLFSIGENLAKENVISPFWGMWMPSISLLPIAFLLMISAANDLKITDKLFWRYLLSFGQKR